MERTRDRSGKRVAREFETQRTQGATKVPLRIAILTRAPSNLEGSDHPAMSQERLSGLFVVLGDLRVSKRGSRQPENTRSEVGPTRSTKMHVNHLIEDAYRKRANLFFGSERSEAKNPRKLRGSMRKAARIRPDGDPSTHSSDSFAQSDSGFVILSERSESKNPPKLRAKKREPAACPHSLDVTQAYAGS